MTIRRAMRISACLAALLSCAAPSAAELIVLAPMLAGDKPVLRAGPKGEPESPIFRRAPADAITKAIGVEATRGAVKFMLALDEQAQKIAGATSPVPLYLLRSREDGGFARRGFWLSEANNTVVWRAEHYIDLMIDKQTLDEGTFEEIFAHEMGHVLLRRLLPKRPNGLSRQPHSSLAVTDYPTAFDEGFATHFQGIARHLTQNPRLKSIDKGLGFKPFLPYWQSNIDRALRIRGVRDNLFVQQQVAASWTGDASSQFDLAHLKNGQQMMSSEGVIATLFYHLMLDGAEASTVLTERYKSLLTSIRALNSQKISSGTPFMISLAQTHIQRDANSKARWLGTILNLTYGATASTAVTRDFTKLSVTGQEGRGDEFVSALKQSRAALSTLTDQVARNPQRLGSAIGPELWLAFKQAGGKIVTLNLNTAERTALADIAGLESTDIDLLLADRTSQGPYANVDDFAARRRAPPLLRKQFEQARALADTVGGFPRP